VSVLALLHSPLTSRAAWGDLTNELLLQGWDGVVEVDVCDDDSPPYAQRYIAAAAVQLARQLDVVTQPVTDPPVAVPPIDFTGQPLVLAGHSGAGPLLAQIAFARRAAGRPVHGYVFVDAGLPRPSNARNRLDLMAIEDPEFAAQLRTHLETGGRFPTWTDAELADEIRDDPARAALVGDLRPRGLDFFTEELPLAEDWPDAPVSYLQLSPAYDQPAATARHRHWPTISLDLGHFATITHPEVVAQAITELAR
jgi:hypothetical protein